MSYVSLYRKWRPQTFAEVTGQAHVVRTLSNALAEKRIAHAYLFTGPRGTGKTTLARLLAKGLNCVQGPTPEPCNRCPSCQRIADGAAMDVVEIDGASNRGIDEIRDVRERVRFAPTEGSYKIYIIDEVHMLTNEAFNALLKVLEEPPQHVVFVFATTEPHKIPATVASRCQRFDFRRLSMAETMARLAAVAEAEGIDATEEALRVIARYAEGSLRDGLGLLDQCRAYAGRVTPEIVTGVMGVAPREQVIAFADVLAAGDVARGLALVRDLQETGRDLRQFLRDAARYLRDVLLYKVAGEQAVGAVVLAGSEESEALRRQAAALPVTLLLRAIEALGAAEGEMRWAAQSHLPLEMAVVRLTRPEAQLEPEQLLQRIERLEQQVAVLAGQRASSASPHREESQPAQDTASQEPEATTAVMAPPEGPAAAAAPVDAGAAPPAPQGSMVRGQHPVPPRSAPRRPRGQPGPFDGEQGERHKEPRRPQEQPGGGTGDAQPADDLALVMAHWDRLREVLKEQRQLAVEAFLREGRPVACRDGVVTIEFPQDRSFHRDNLQSDQNRKVVEQFLSRLVGRKLKVTTALEGEGAPEAPPGTGGAGPEASPAQDNVDDVVNDPAVQEALRLFGGRIIHVQRDRR